jgi:hypothetical protein|tara:strand:+ start:4223 stop:4525 length:303 start_codon:yes stop_codon:yes gene_type:complete
MAAYSGTSPWFNTPTKEGQYLDILKIRPIPAESDDVLYTVQPQYNHRPDLLAFDLYGNKDLWWVFAQRNMEIIKDPIFDLEPGVEIYVPKGDALTRILGI